ARSRSAGSDAVYRQAAVHGGLSDKDMVSFHADARRFATYLRFFARLEYGHRRKLVHAATGIGIFDHLCTDAGWKRFRDSLGELRSVRFVTSVEDFHEFLSRWPGVKAVTRRVIEGQTKAIAKVAQALAGGDVMEALSRSDGEFGDAIRASGFLLDNETARALAERARRTLDTRLLERSVADPRMRQAVAGRVDVLPKDVSVQTMWDILKSRRHASWYVMKLGKEGLARPGLDSELVVKLADVKAAARQMARAERIEAELGGGFLGLGERMGWLVFVSMLVCVVGISNAMLMSVTERFREIATLKCLGALDRFIMLMFVLEAAFLGIVGGIAGAVLGALLGTVITLLSYGGLVLRSIPIGELSSWILFSIVLGVVLAAVAAVYPSFKAARLAPMEAMRIE
ncbi:MAG: ABC transporter permease, partial [Planctomycetota bacterium]